MTVSRKTAFVAEGQSTGTAAGFSTYAQHIGVGVDVYGNTVGVHGKGGLLVSTEKASRPG